MNAKKFVLAFLSLALMLFIGIHLIACCDGHSSQEDNFEKWNNVCDESHDDNLKHLAAEKMSQSANTFKEWNSVHLCAKYHSELETSAWEKMYTLADEFNESLELATRAFFRHDAARMKKALKKMSQSANTFKEWNSVAEFTRYAYGEDDSHLSRTAIINMINLAHSCDDWYDIYQRARENDKELKKTALDKMVQSARSLKDWSQVYECAPKGSKFQKLALKKIIELTEQSKF